MSPVCIRRSALLKLTCGGSWGVSRDLMMDVDDDGQLDHITKNVLIKV